MLLHSWTLNQKGKEMETYKKQLLVQEIEFTSANHEHQLSAADSVFTEL